MCVSLCVCFRLSIKKNKEKKKKEKCHGEKSNYHVNTNHLSEQGRLVFRREFLWISIWRLWTTYYKKEANNVIIEISEKSDHNSEGHKPNANLHAWGKTHFFAIDICFFSYKSATTLVCTSFRGNFSVGSPPFYHSKFRPCTVHTQAIQTHENKSRDELDTLCIKSCR